MGIRDGFITSKFIIFVLNFLYKFFTIRGITIIGLDKDLNCMNKGILHICHLGITLNEITM